LLDTKVGFLVQMPIRANALSSTKLGFRSERN